MDNKKLQSIAYQFLTGKQKDPNILLSGYMDHSYKDLMYVATSITKDYQLSEEVVNDVFISIYEEGVYRWLFRVLADCGANYAGYLSTTCANKSKNAIRSRKFFEEINDDFSSSFASITPNYDYIDFDFNEVIETLDEKEQCILNQYFVEGKSHKEICEANNFISSEENSRVILYRTKNKLKELLKNFKT